MTEEICVLCNKEIITGQSYRWGYGQGAPEPKHTVCITEAYQERFRTTGSLGLGGFYDHREVPNDDGVRTVITTTWGRSD